jgi:hypothetical protein
VANATEASTPAAAHLISFLFMWFVGCFGVKLAAIGDKSKAALLQFGHESRR